MKSMTVAQLIEELQKYDLGLPVVIHDIFNSGEIDYLTQETDDVTDRDSVFINGTCNSRTL